MSQTQVFIVQLIKFNVPLDKFKDSYKLIVSMLQPNPLL